MRLLKTLVPLSLLVSMSVTGAPEKPSVKSPIVRITSHVYRIGTLIVDTASRTVTAPGSINMDKGSVEYLAVTPRGKTYESFLRLDVQPMYLNLALILIGCKSKNVLQYQGQNKTPEGAPVTITVHWHNKLGIAKEARAEDFLTLMPGNHPMPLHPWVFTGSRILPQGYEADMVGSLVAIWHDPAAVMDNPLPTGADDGWVVNTARTPPQFTPIHVVFKAVG